MEKTLRDVMARRPTTTTPTTRWAIRWPSATCACAEALALIDKALEMAPEDPFIMDSMGWVQYRLGNLDAAEAHLRAAYALRKDPEIARAPGRSAVAARARRPKRSKLRREARAKDPEERHAAEHAGAPAA